MTFADDGDDQEIIDVRYVLQFVLIVVDLSLLLSFGAFL